MCKDVVILVKITDVYASPQFQFFFDPASLLSSSRFLPEDGWLFRAAIRDHDQSTSQTCGDLSRGVTADDETGPVDIRGQIRSLQIPKTPSKHGRGGHKRNYKTLSKQAVSRSQGGQQQSSSTTSSMRVLQADIRLRFSTSTMSNMHRLENKQFRLFVLFPRSGETIRGMICTMDSFESAGAYRTLSYCWGICNELSHHVVTPKGTVKIRASLHAALLQLRHKE